MSTRKSGFTDLTEANGENSKLSSSENALCIVVLEKKGRPLLRNAVGLAFTVIWNYLDEKKSNPHKQFREKKLLGFYLHSLAFRQNILNILFTTTIYKKRKIVIPAVLPKAIGNLSAFCFSRPLKRVAHSLERGRGNQSVCRLQQQAG